MTPAQAVALTGGWQKTKGGAGPARAKDSDLGELAMIAGAFPYAKG